MVLIALILQHILQYKLMSIFSIKCYLRANLKIDVTKNGVFWGTSRVKSKSEIHFPAFTSYHVKKGSHLQWRVQGGSKHSGTHTSSISKTVSTYYRLHFLDNLPFRALQTVIKYSNPFVYNWLSEHRYQVRN